MIYLHQKTKQKISHTWKNQKNLSEDLHKHINITSVFYCNIL